MKISMSACLLFILFGLSLSVIAQEGETQELSDLEKKEAVAFTGVVQYVQGQASWEKRPFRDASEAIGFKTFFHPGDQVDVKENSYIKFITEKRCVGVFFGPGKLMPPGKSDQVVWSTEGGSLRWICGIGQTENLKLIDHGITLQGGEIFFHKNDLLVRRGRVLSENGELKEGFRYRNQNGKWMLVEDDPKYERWAFNNSLPAPIESIKEPQPKRPISSRWIIGPVFGGNSMTHNNDLHSMDDLDLEGGRMMTNFIWDGHSIMASLTGFESQSPKCREMEPSQTGPSQTDPPPEDINCSQIESFLAEIGLRFNHDKFWSFFSKVGLSRHKFIPRTHTANWGVPEGVVVDYMAVNISGGIDVTWVPEFIGWGGFYFSAEIFLNRSFGDGQVSEEGNMKYPIPNEVMPLEGAMTQVGMLMQMGLMLQF